MERLSTSCLDSGRHVAQVQNDLKEGQRVGLTGTPTMFINGVIVDGGAVGFSVLEGLIKRRACHGRHQGAEMVRRTVLTIGILCGASAAAALAFASEISRVGSRTGRGRGLARTWRLRSAGVGERARTAEAAPGWLRLTDTTGGSIVGFLQSHLSSGGRGTD